MLKIQGLDVRYGVIRALHGIDVEVPAGQIVTLIGSNGAGKTTTLRTVSGLLPVSSGTITFEGTLISGMPPHQIVRLGVSQAPEGRGVFPNLSVSENLSLGAFVRKDKAGIARDLEEVLVIFPRLRERLSQSAGTLSGGEQQMLAIARAMLARPKLMLLDEPSLGLAPQVVATIFKTIRQINARGTTILLVEQNARMALAVSHFGYVLEAGRIVLSGKAKDLAESDGVRKAYLGGH